MVDERMIRELYFPYLGIEAKVYGGFDSFDCAEKAASSLFLFDADSVFIELCDFTFCKLCAFASVPDAFAKTKPKKKLSA